jgi:hypothetical protein
MSYAQGAMRFEAALFACAGNVVLFVIAGTLLGQISRRDEQNDA